jgi:Flp pilus assembly protein TadD
VTTQRVTARHRGARTAGHFVGADRLGTNGNGNGRSGGRPASASRGTGSWHRPTPAHAQRAASGTGSWTAASTIQRGSTARRRTGRVIALVALLIAIGGVGALALSGLGGGSKRAAQRASAPPKRATTHTHAAAARPKAAATTQPLAQSSTTRTPPTPAPPTAEQLQLIGHNELRAGNYPEAIATLRKAILAADHSSMTYAYGLYDLGVALLKSGDPAGAVTILEQRLKIPNQTPVVQQTLNEALQASGQAPAPGPGNGHGKGKPKGHGPGGPGSSGGAGLAPQGPGSGGEHTNFVD